MQLSLFALSNATLSIYRDRIRTAVNVLGDSIGAGIISHVLKNDLPDLEEAYGNHNGALNDHDDTKC